MRGSSTPFPGLQCALFCRGGHRVYTISTMRRNLSGHTNCISCSAIYRRFYEPTTHAAIQTTVLQEEKCWGQWGDYRGPFTFLVAFEKCVSPGGVKLTASQFDITDASAPKNPTDYTPQCRWQRRTEASAAFPGIATIIMCVGPRPFFRLPSWFFCSGFLALLILALPAKPRKAGNKDGSPEKKIHDSVLV